MQVDDSVSERKTLVGLLRYRARVQPDKMAYTFFSGSESQASIGYAGLDLRARSIGARLQEFVTFGDRVLLIYPSGLEYISAFFGCLYAGAVAVTAYPPKFQQKLEDRNLRRLRSMVRDCSPTVVLTTTAICGQMEDCLSHLPELRDVHLVATDAIGDEFASLWREPHLNEQCLAFLQYTSGTTMAPRGVMVSHRNLLSNERMIQHSFGHDAHTVFVSWLPLFHDMGLIGNVLQPVYLGIPGYYMAPAAFFHKPLRWLEAISRFKGTSSGGPNFAYELCLQRIKKEDLQGLDLSSWRVAFNGAGHIHGHTMREFANRFRVCGFRPEAFHPCYGLAEATLMVSGARFVGLSHMAVFSGNALKRGLVRVGAEAGPVLVGSGRPVEGVKLVVVDPQTHAPLPASRVGEIWISGANVALGYWNSPDENKRCFGVRVRGRGELFFRTGDMGFLLNGQLYVTGRLRDVIRLNGMHYPQHIELTVERCFPGLSPDSAAAFVAGLGGRDRLVVGIELRRVQNVDVAELVGRIRQAVLDGHDLDVFDVVLLRKGSLPKTTSGKLQRHVCRERYLAGGLGLSARENFGVSLSNIIRSQKALGEVSQLLGDGRAVDSL